MSGHVQLLDERHPGSLALRDLVELVLEVGREIEVDDVAELAHEQVVDEHADIGRLQATILAFDVAALLDRGQDGRVGARAADAALLHAP